MPWLIGISGGAITKPRPKVWLSRSSRVISRWAATVSSSGPSIRFSTRRFFSSGSQRSTGSSRAILPASTRVMATAAVIGLVIEAMRKIASRLTGAAPSKVVEPTATP